MDAFTWDKCILLEAFLLDLKKNDLGSISLLCSLVGTFASHNKH